MVGSATLTMLKSNWSTNCAAQINASALTAGRRTIDCVKALMIPVLPITCDSALALQSLGVSPGNFVPVDDIPPRGEIVRAAVLVLEVVGVFPYVVAHNRILTVH